MNANYQNIPQKGQNAPNYTIYKKYQVGSPLLNIEFMETLITEITNIFLSGKSSPPPHLEMLKV